MPELDDEHRAGHLDERDLRRVLTRPFRIRRGGAAVARRPPKRAPSGRKASGRVGLVHGWPTRTTTIKVEPARRGGALARYTHRLHAASDRDAEDLETSSADGAGIAAFERTIAGVEAAIAAAGDAVPRDRRAAAYGLVIDLPYDGDPEYRAAVMRTVAAWFESRGHRAEWAVHSRSARNGDYPHGHLVVAAGADGTRPIDGGDVMKNFRRHVAETVNQLYAERFHRRLPIEFHGGTLRDTGITRPPRPDIPRGLWHAREAARDHAAVQRPVPQRTAALAAAADRIEAAWARDVAAGRLPEPQGLARRRWRTEQREGWLAFATRLSARQADLRRQLTEREATLEAERASHRGALTRARVQGEFDGQRWFVRSCVVPNLPPDVAAQYHGAPPPEARDAGRWLAERLVQARDDGRLAERLRQENQALRQDLATARDKAAGSGRGIAALAGRALGFLRGGTAPRDVRDESATAEAGDPGVWTPPPPEPVPPASATPSALGAAWTRHDAEYRHPGVLFPLPAHPPSPPVSAAEPAPSPAVTAPAPAASPEPDADRGRGHAADGTGPPRPPPGPVDPCPPSGGVPAPPRRRSRGQGRE
ncbi:hypothetical protein C1S70_31160 (plasmid) [Azospirillum argentinense]|uniref:MobA/MobL protein domain-containing protein n=1 Tax=Azospirillum argentinense TaxID=2970906 RepID=A0A2K1FR66_9PROT|nr:hypothetical protein [Azospirillum argentinense]PNQ95032.1 hypothetical protein C1S70_31160 [Azospirillum argentinense]